jgi:hypothetical protein
MKQTRIFKGKERLAARFEFVDESRASVGEENPSERIGCERYGGIELSGVMAFFSPRAEEFEWGRRGWLWPVGRGVGPPRAEKSS